MTCETLLWIMVWGASDEPGFVRLEASIESEHVRGQLDEAAWDWAAGNQMQCDEMH